jgi:hypothetical protein
LSNFVQGVHQESAMTAIVTDWRTELIKAHRGLFYSPAGTPAARGCISCGDGWRDLLERAFAKIEAIVDDGGSFGALQIKEKDGTLRLYWRCVLSDKNEAKINEAIDLASARSACTCSECGEEARLYRSGSDLLTRCAVHAVGRLVDIKPGLENVHIVHRTVQDGTRIVTCSRYDRATHAFVDVPPDYLRTVEKLHGAFSLPSLRRGRDVRAPQRLARVAERRLHHRDLRRRP